MQIHFGQTTATYQRPNQSKPLVASPLQTSTDSFQLQFGISRKAAKALAKTTRPPGGRPVTAEDIERAEKQLKDEHIPVNDATIQTRAVANASN